jgi:hypothetical protein
VKLASCFFLIIGFMQPLALSFPEVKSEALFGAYFNFDLRRIASHSSSHSHGLDRISVSGLQSGTHSNARRQSGSVPAVHELLLGSTNRAMGG